MGQPDGSLFYGIAETMNYDVMNRLNSLNIGTLRQLSYARDNVGNITAMVDDNNNIIWEADFSPFMEIYRERGSITQPFRFPGQYYDEETGLHQNGFRDYNPEVGRFLEPDPIGIQQGNNHLYVYVDNNSLIYFDTKGECPSTIDTGWKYRTAGPNKATDYKYQAEYKERTIGILIDSSGSCSDKCEEDKILYCKYRLSESWYRRTRTYNRKTNKYGEWNEWEGWEDKYRGIATLKYSCRQQQFIGSHDYTR